MRARSVQVHDSPSSARRPGSAWRSTSRAWSAPRSAAATRSSRPARSRVSYRLEVALEELEPIADGARLTVHHGTRRRSRPGRTRGRRATRSSASRAPVVAARGDRVVLRDATTVGGAIVLDPAPPRGRDAERDRLLGQGDPRSIVRALVHEPVRVEALAGRALLGEAELEEGLDAVRVVDGWAFADAWLEETAAVAEERLRARAEEAPLDPGLSLAELLPAAPWAPVVVAQLPFERRGGAVYLPGTAASVGSRAQAAAALEATLADTGLAATRVSDADLARFLEAEGRLVRLGDGFAVGAGAYEVARDIVLGECGTAGEISLARFRDLAGVGRRDAQLLLERMDVDGVTRRVGDRRVLRRGAGRAVRD